MALENTHASSKNKRVFLLILLVIFLIITFWFGLKTWRIIQSGQALLEKKTEIELLIADGVTNIDPEEAETLVMDTRADIHTLKRETAVFMPLTPYLGWVPKIGATLVAAPALMQMAESGIDAAAFATRSLKPALTITQNHGDVETSKLSQLSAILVDAAPDLVAANEKMIEVAEARKQITNIADQPDQIKTLLRLSDDLLPFAQDGLELTAVLPEIMGKNGKRTYLIIAQNEDELRPTGGFISGAGTFVVENGEMISLEMVDAYTIDDWASKPYDFPPQPFYDYMDIDLFLFRDSNFWPDFPTSAEKAMDLYAYGQNLPPLDGVIAIDQEFVRLLVEATGPIYIEENDLTINPSNAIETLQNAWSDRTTSDNNSEWFVNRKAFIGIFASAIIDYIENDFEAIDPLRLLQNMQKAIDERHLQIYMREPNAQNKLDLINWDGRLENQLGQDFVGIVETNMGFNKANYLIERTINYHATLDNQGNGTAKLNITYKHPQQGSENDCIQFDWDVYSDGGSYLELSDKCYWNYLRAYVPNGSQLISATEHPVPGTAMRSGKAVNAVSQTFTEQNGFTIFDNFLMVPYGQVVSSEFQYMVPTAVTLDENGTAQYQLTIRKQAGTDSDTAQVTVTIPSGTLLLEANPLPSTINGQNIVFDLSLDTDKTITVSYR